MREREKYLCHPRMLKVQDMSLRVSVFVCMHECVCVCVRESKIEVCLLAGASRMLNVRDMSLRVHVFVYVMYVCM